MDETAVELPGSPRVALSHDWLTGMRGGERVLELLCKEFPDARLYTLIHNPRAVVEQINQHVAGTSWLQYLPGITRYYRYALPVLPKALDTIKIEPCDLLISTSHCVAKGLPVEKSTPHLCYCFTPMRYAWAFYEEYFGKNKLKKMVLGAVLEYLREWDRKNAQEVTHFVAISKHIQNRIKKCYGKPSDIIYPPVDVDRFSTRKEVKGEYDLIVSALVPYKRVDLAVKAYNKTKKKLKIVGTGSEYKKIRQIAGPTIDLLGWQSDEDIENLYRGCRFLVFPGEEDFGIVPVEAQACGTPVVAYARGGALETVKAGVSGVFFEEQNEEALVEATERCAQTDWNPQAIRKNAEQFAPGHFIEQLRQSVKKTLSQANKPN